MPFLKPSGHYLQGYKMKTATIIAKMQPSQIGLTEIYYLINLIFLKTLNQKEKIF